MAAFLKRDDTFFMQQALALAVKAAGRTSPNPLVGAILVNKQARVIGRGYHHKAGLPHAEIEALRSASEKPRGATLYVNLEPCGHWGKTPPCVDAILRSGIQRVVVAMKDPNPLMQGASLKTLRRNGIAVTEGIMEEPARRLNEIFIKNMTQRSPFVTVKVAESLDGKIATFRKDSSWITEERARVFARHLRSMHDAVMVGIGTVVHDNPHLDASFPKENFTKVILDKELRVRPGGNIFKNSVYRVIIVCDTRCFHSHARKIKLLQRQGNVHVVGMPAKPSFSMGDLMKKLYDSFSICSVFVEGGAETIGHCFDDRIADKICFFIAPKIIGGTEALSSVGGAGVALAKNAVVIKDVTARIIGRDFLFTGYPVYKKASNP